MADYTAPAGDDVNFSFDSGYSAPDGDDVNFLFGLVANISMFDPSRTTVYDDSGTADTSILKWRSDIEGDYRIILGGTDHTDGYLLDEGWAPAEYILEHTVTVADFIAAGLSPGEHSVNVYVLSEDNIWSP